MLICPNCGEENLPQATRCLHCGLDLEQVFSINGLENNRLTDESLSKSDGTDLPEILQELRKSQKEDSENIKKIDLQSNDKPGIQQSHNTSKDALNFQKDEETLPEWLRKVRERAKSENDSSGELVKKVSGRDEIENKPRASELDEDFDGWIAQIRDNARRDAALSVSEDDSDLEDEEIPSWLKRLREIENVPLENDSVDNDVSNEDKLPEWIKKSSDSDNFGSPDIGRETAEQKAEESTQPISIDKTSDDLTLNADVKTKLDHIAQEENINLTSEESDELLSKLNEKITNISLSPELAIKSGKEEFEDPYKFASLDHRERMKILTSMVGLEGKSNYISRTSKGKKKNFSRIIIFLIVMLLLIFTLLRESSATQPSGEMQPTVLALYNRIENLTPLDKVIVALDYQPAVSSELDLVSQPVLQHLAEQDTRITILSTRLEGSWLGDSLFENTERLGLKFSSQEIIYLPGGKLGALLLSMGEQGLSPSWHQYFQSKVGDLSDYKLILVLVDNYQNARNWIELIQPQIKDVPIAMITSSQETLLLEPYWESGQLTGLLAGFNEANLYASNLNLDQNEVSDYKAFQVGVLVMLVFMVIGLILNIGKSSTEYATTGKGKNA